MYLVLESDGGASSLISPAVSNVSALCLKAPWMQVLCCDCVVQVTHLKPVDQVSSVQWNQSDFSHPNQTCSTAGYWPDNKRERSINQK